MKQIIAETVRYTISIDGSKKDARVGLLMYSSVIFLTMEEAKNFQGHWEKAITALSVEQARQ